MSKNEETREKEAEAPAKAAPSGSGKDQKASEKKTFKMTVDEFCTRLSGKDNRVELIGAFNKAEKRAKRIKDTETNFRSRYEAFVKKPVQ